MRVQQYIKKLGLDHSVTAQEAKDAYKTLVRIWHPDQFSNDPVFKTRAEEKLKEINVAYSEVKLFLSLQDKPCPLYKSGIQKLVLTLSSCGSIARQLGANFFELLQKLYEHAHSGCGLNDEFSGTGAFKEIGGNAMRFRDSIDNEFQNVLNDVIREKTRPSEFGN